MVEVEDIIAVIGRHGGIKNQPADAAPILDEAALVNGETPRRTFV
jgi:hypothetical protein